MDENNLRIYKKNEKKIFSKVNIMIYLMIVPGVVLYYIFRYITMPGIMIAFQEFTTGGFKYWCGFENFDKLFGLRAFWQAFRNTWVFIGLEYLFIKPSPIILALLLNEVRIMWFKKTVQTLSTLPNFLTWVVVSGIFIQLLSPSTGYVNAIIALLGGERIYFLGKAQIFPWLLTVIRVWRGVGYSSIIYLAALGGVDPELYEAAVIDGASRWKQTMYVTLPGIKNTIVVLLVFSFSGIMGGLFEPVFTLTDGNSLLDETAMVLDVYIYNTGIRQGKFSMSTTTGLFNSIISTILMLSANFASKYLTEDGRTII
ncbi:MAG: ABC transporter permease subunit [Clostridia bacterium]